MPVHVSWSISSATKRFSFDRGELLELERVEELSLGVVDLGELGTHAGAALASAGGRVDEGRLVDL